MPSFGSHFSSLANDKKITHEELVRAMRFMASTEYEATQMYMQLAESTGHPLAIKVLADIASEERVPAGEFLRLLHALSPANTLMRCFIDISHEIHMNFETADTGILQKSKIAQGLASACMSANTLMGDGVDNLQDTDLVDVKEITLDIALGRSLMPCCLSVASWAWVKRFSPCHRWPFGLT